MKQVIFRTLCMAVVSLFLVQCVSAQKWLNKLNKGLDKTNEILNSVNGSTEQSSQPSDTIDAKAFLNEAPSFEVKKLTILNEDGDTLRYEDGSIQYHYLVYDKDGKICHPETAKKLTNAALKSAGIILLKIGGTTTLGGVLGKKAGGKKGAWIGSATGLVLGAALSAGDIKNIKAKTKELKAYKQALEKYQATFTEEGLPRDAEADLSDYADCEELTQDALVVQAQIKESIAQGEGMSLEDVDMDELDRLLKETEG